MLAFTLSYKNIFINHSNNILQTFQESTRKTSKEKFQFFFFSSCFFSGGKGPKFLAWNLNWCFLTSLSHFEVNSSFPYHLKNEEFSRNIEMEQFHIYVFERKSSFERKKLQWCLCVASCSIDTNYILTIERSR